MSWSKSKLKTFRGCSQKYKMAYIDKIPQEKVESLNKGIILHDFYNHFYDYFPENNINNSILHTVKQLNITESFQNQYEKYVLSFIDFNNKHKEFNNPLLREKKYNIGGWAGIIDRVDRYKDGYILIDYKTSNGSSLTEYLDELLLYAYMVKEEEELNIIAVAIFYTENNNFVIKEITNKEIDNNLEVMNMEKEEYDKRIIDNEFEYTPSFECRWCGYAKTCKAKIGFKE